MQMQSSVVKIKRKKQLIGSLAFFEIILDGENVGIIFSTQTISVPVEPGHHSIKMSQFWVGSEEINFSIGSGEEITFECDIGFWLLPRLQLIQKKQNSFSPPNG